MKKIWKVTFSDSFRSNQIWCEEETIEDVVKVAESVKEGRLITGIELVSSQGITRRKKE